LSYYRMELPAAALAERGHEVTVSSTMADVDRDEADVIVGQRVCLPAATVRWQNLAKQGRAKLVYEIDDDLFQVHPSSKVAAPFFNHPEIQANLRANLQVADVVTVTTDHLAEQLAPYNDNIVVLPNCVPAALCDTQPARREGVLTVGWGGSATHAIDWRGPDEHIARVIRRRADTELHVLGWRPDILWRLVPEGRRRFTDWLHRVPDLHATLDYHVGVIPLRDIPFNRSKSDIKLLELAALGIPAICSNAGPYASSGTIAGSLMVNRPMSWERHLVELLDDEALRARVGKAANSWARGRTMEGNAHRWEEAYR
jgi:glycosyltransferase involved in cell wall biosynthesis